MHYLSYVALGAFLISFSAVFVSISQAGAFAAGFYRLLFGGTALLFYCIIFRKRLWVGRRPFLWACGAGVLFALDLSFWHNSIYFVGPGHATLLANFQVIFLAVAGVLFFREVIGIRLVVAVLLAMIGMFLMFGSRWNDLSRDYRTGVIYGLVTALCYSGYILTLKKSQTGSYRLSPVANMAVICYVSAFIMGAEALAWGESLKLSAPVSWLSLLGYGLICQAFAWVFISKALPRVDASRAGLVLLLQPACAMIWDKAFFNPSIQMAEIAGVIIALTAIYLGSATTKK